MAESLFSKLSEAGTSISEPARMSTDQLVQGIRLNVQNTDVLAQGIQSDVENTGALAKVIQLKGTDSTEDLPASFFNLTRKSKRRAAATPRS